jgi:hypothetical protein
MLLHPVTPLNQAAAAHTYLLGIVGLGDGLRQAENAAGAVATREHEVSSPT